MGPVWVQTGPGDSSRKSEAESASASGVFALALDCVRHAWNDYGPSSEFVSEAVCGCLAARHGATLFCRFADTLRKVTPVDGRLVEEIVQVMQFQDTYSGFSLKSSFGRDALQVCATDNFVSVHVCTN